MVIRKVAECEDIGQFLFMDGYNEVHDQERNGIIHERSKDDDVPIAHGVPGHCHQGMHIGMLLYHMIPCNEYGKEYPQYKIEKDKAKKEYYRIEDFYR